MKIKIISLLGAPLLLTSCAIGYVEPATGPAATIHFDKSNGVQYAVQTYENASDCSGGRRLAVKTTDGTEAVKFPANKELSLTFSVDNSHSTEFVNGRLATVYRYCMITISFQAEGGATYYSRFDNASGIGCSILLTKREAGSDEGKPVPFKKRNWIRGFSESSSFCSPE